MREYKKLFRRDRTFWMCAGGVMLLILIWAVFKYAEEIRLQRQMCQFALNYRHWSQEDVADIGLQDWKKTVEGLYVQTAWLIFFAAGVAQLIKWHILEGEKRKELTYLLPVKSFRCLTYDLLSGALLIWTPLLLCTVLQLFSIGEVFLENFAAYLMVTGDNFAEWMAVGLFLYSLIFFARSVANRLPDAVFMAFLMWLTPLMIGGTITKAAPEDINLGDKIEKLYKFAFYDSHARWTGAAALTALAVLLIALAYVCEKRKDHAGTGSYAFRAVRYLVVAASFLDLFIIFCVSILTYDYWNRVRFLKWIGAAVCALLAAVMSVGLNYLFKPAAQKKSCL